MTIQQLDKLDKDWEEWELDPMTDYDDDFIDKILNFYPELSRYARKALNLEAFGIQSGF